jgi:hypothetical protein
MTRFRVEVGVRVAEAPGVVLAGVPVVLYDRDRASTDDEVGRGVTDTSGRLVVEFDEARFAELEDRSLPLGTAVPEIYAALRDAKGHVVVSTRDRAQRALGGLLLDLPVPGRVALDAGWAQRGTRAASEPVWRKLPELDRCLARTVLDMVAGLDAPRSELQQRLARRTAAIPVDTRARIAAAAKQSVSRIDAANALDGHRCKDDPSPNDVFELLKRGPLGTIMQALGERERSPAEIAADSVPRAGLPFWETVEHGKDCKDRFRQRGIEIAPVDKQLVPPQIALAKVYDDAVGQTVRNGEVRNRLVTHKIVDPELGWKLKPVSLAHDVNDPECFVHKTEPGTERQVFFVDMVPGQWLTLYGAGFVADRCRVRIRRHDWREEPDAEGRLVPADISTIVPGWDEAANPHATPAVFGGEVHPTGTTPTTYADDWLTFQWTDLLAQPGLYAVELEFENRTDPQIPTTVTETAKCGFARSFGPVRSAPLYVAVLNAPLARKVRPRITQVRCRDKTDPFGLLPYVDDVEVRGGATISQLLVGEEPQASHEAGSGGHLFWRDGDRWDLDLPLLEAEERLRFDHVLIEHAVALEVFGAFDRFLLQAVLSIVWIAVLILVAALAAALALAVVGVAAYLSAGIGAALVKPAFALVAVFWTFLFTVAGPAGLAAIGAFVANLNIDATVVSQASSAITGIELACRLSPVRFWRATWFGERPARIEGSPPADVTATFAGSHVTEEFDCRRGDTRYLIRIDSDARVG